jgi:RES domain-containing protein
MNLWRISNHHSLNGEGGRLYAGRWNSVGSPIVYLADSTGSAMVEVLVHLQVEDGQTPPSYTLLRIAVPDTLEIPLLPTPTGEAWKFDLSLTRKLGDTWLKSRRSALARVPSVILPETFNYLLNPLHPDAAKIRITKSQTARFDLRLLHKPQKPLTPRLQ